MRDSVLTAAVPWLYIDGDPSRGFQHNSRVALGGTMASTGQEYTEGDAVIIQTGEQAGKSGKVTKVYPTQATALGKESRYMYETDVGVEIYRAQDLRRDS